MPYLILLLILGAGVYFTLRGQKKDPLGEVNVWPYIKTVRPLSPPEIGFYAALRQYLPPQLIICPKMALERVVYVPQNARLVRSMKEKIKGRCVDFALCDGEMNLVCVIDLIADSDGEAEAAWRPELAKIAHNAAVSLFTYEPAFEYNAEMFAPIAELFASGEYK